MIPIIPFSFLLLTIYWIRYFFLYSKNCKMQFHILLFVTIMFIPKINLLSVSTLSTAGIRADDIIVALLLVASWNPQNYNDKLCIKGLKILLLLSCSCIIALMLGLIKGYGNSIAFAILVIVRRFEYFSLFLSGLHIARVTKNFEAVFYKEFTILNIGYAIVALLQVVGLCSYAVSGGEKANFFGGMAVSTFNGYYEYGMFLCMSAAYYLCHYLKNKNRRSLAMLIALCVLLYLTNSRTTLIAFIFVFILIIITPVERKSKKPIRIIKTMVIIFSIILLIGFSTGLIGEKQLGRLSNVNIIEMWKYLYNNIKTRDFMSYVQLYRSGIRVTQVMGESKDISAGIRFYKWGAALNGFFKNFLFGYGSGVTHVMDGNYVKILAETGTIGAFLWYKYWSLYQNNLKRYRNLCCYVESSYFMMLSVLFGALFIDMFEASKIMEFLWMMVGASIYIIKSRYIIDDTKLVADNHVFI